MVTIRKILSDTPKRSTYQLFGNDGTGDFILGPDI